MANNKLPRLAIVGDHEHAMNQAHLLGQVSVVRVRHSGLISDVLEDGISGGIGFALEVGTGLETDDQWGSEARKMAFTYNFGHFFDKLTRGARGAQAY